MEDEQQASAATEFVDRRDVRMARERSMIAVAKADLKAGRFVADAAAEDWLGAWERSEDRLDVVKKGRPRT